MEINQQIEISDEPRKEKSDIPRFKTKGEAEAHCLKELGISMSELKTVQGMKKEFRPAVRAFYAIMRHEGIRMDKISEIQRRDAFVRGYLYGLSVAKDEKTDV